MPSLKKSLPLAGASARADSAPWRSVSEFDSGLVPGAEFGPGADALPADGTSRRSFVQLLGAAAGLATLGGCLKQPDEKMLPYARQPEEVVPGTPLHYATATSLGGHAVGLLATSYEGRPTKIEGNPQHPASRGASGVFEQAHLLDLYDPSRLKVILENGSTRSTRDFLSAMLQKSAELQKSGGEGLRFLVQPSASPLIASLRARLLERFPKARFHTFDPLGSQERHDGAVLAFGAPLETRVSLSKADVILCLDADPLASFPGNLRAMSEWAERRDPAPGEMNRLYAVEAHFSVTGMNADHRLRVKPSGVQRFALALLGRLASQVPALSRYAGLSGRFPLQGEEQKFADALARDLVRAGSRAAVLAGPRQPAVVQAAAHAINAALNSAAVSQAKPVLHDTDSGPRTLKALVDEIQAGKVDTLVVTAWNPVYAATGDLEVGKALSKVPTTVYRALYLDETAQVARWVIPAAHELESWGDGLAADGTLTFQQPLVAPLFGGATEAEVLASLLGEGDRPTYAQLRDLYRGKADDLVWEKWIADGFVDGTATPTEKPAVRHEAVLAAASKVEAASTQGFELNLIPSYSVLDGRFGNNGWLQELPDPVTKLTWENAALLSVRTARELGVRQGDLVELSVGGGLGVKAPVVVVPGHTDGVVTAALGYGRRSTAEALCQNLGFDVAPLRTQANPWFASGLQIAKTGKTHLIAQTQEHHSMEGRVIALSTPVEKLPELEKEVLEVHRGIPETMYAPQDYSHGYKWGMAIDLSKCTGCNACMIACQSENNVPVVGKERVANSREMHWLRIDRYFTGNELENPGVVFQPLACVHCETAPCEYVCPVNATVHSDEGLNEMVYNRCVGTRYCSNNCPYKVRRFNFFSYTSDYSDVEKMVFNPDVTVRARGVMEKCTYCVQRIERARISTRREDRTIHDGELQSACQQACPTDAIVFGNLNEEGALVRKLHDDRRRYDLLHDLGTRPRTAYLARVTNPNPELA